MILPQLLDFVLRVEFVKQFFIMKSFFHHDAVKSYDILSTAAWICSMLDGLCILILVLVLVVPAKFKFDKKDGGKGHTGLLSLLKSHFLIRRPTRTKNNDRKSCSHMAVTPHTHIALFTRWLSIHMASITPDSSGISVPNLVKKKKKKESFLTIFKF